MIEPTLFAGLMLGLASSVHCVAMCGGIASALDRLGPESAGRTQSHLLYAFGRVASYALLGATVGIAGSTVAQWLGPEQEPKVRMAIRIGLGLTLIALAAGVAGSRVMRKIEQLGRGIWKRMRPLTVKLTGLPAPIRTIGLGALWGFIPCGMVYGALAAAVMTGTVTGGASFMAAFGIGTIPAVLSTGIAAASVWDRVGRQNVRRISAIAVALCGVWVIVGPMILNATSQTAHHH